MIQYLTVISLICVSLNIYIPAYHEWPLVIVGRYIRVNINQNNEAVVVCYPYVLVCTRMYSYVIRVALFTI